MNPVFLLFMILAIAQTPPANQEAKQYVCILDPQIKSTQPGPCPVCAYDLIPADLASSGLYSFTCTDHREIQQSIPGLCPKCKKKLLIEDLRAKGNVTYVCPMHPAVTSSFPGRCSRCAMDLVPEDQLRKKSAAYRCPMDPEVVEGIPGSCSKCGMALLPVDPSELVRFPVTLTAAPESFRSGQAIQLTFSIFNPVTRERAIHFDIVHDKPFHLFVTSQDLEFFDHIHPEQVADGSFVIKTIFPRPGYYRLYADFLPTGGSPQVTQKNLVTSDCQADLYASLARLRPDKVRAKTVDGTTVTLKSDLASFIAGREATLLYSFTDADTGKPVTDLKPYLGAWGHTFILNEDGSESIHSHPLDQVAVDSDSSALHNKPEISFQALFPKPGYYRVWSQFMRNDRVSTFIFTIEVQRLH